MCIRDRHIIHDMIDAKMHEHRSEKPVILPLLQHQRRIHGPLRYHKCRVLTGTSDLQVQKVNHIYRNDRTIYIRDSSGIPLHPRSLLFSVCLYCTMSTKVVEDLAKCSYYIILHMELPSFFHKLEDSIRQHDTVPVLQADRLIGLQLIPCLLYTARCV